MLERNKLIRNNNMHPFILPTPTSWVMGLSPTITVWDPEQDTSPSEGHVESTETTVLLYGHFRVTNYSNMHGLWKDIGIIRANPPVHGKNMQAPHKKAGKQSYDLLVERRQL